MTINQDVWLKQMEVYNLTKHEISVNEHPTSYQTKEIDTEENILSHGTYLI
jgi:TRAP-type C4-dicarboxylate transport system substrate-binding protein